MERSESASANQVGSARVNALLLRAEWGLFKQRKGHPKIAARLISDVLQNGPSAARDNPNLVERFRLVEAAFALEQKRYAVALRVGEQVLRKQEALLGSEDFELAETLVIVGRGNAGLRRRNAAGAAFERAVRVASQDERTRMDAKLWHADLLSSERSAEDLQRAAEMAEETRRFFEARGHARKAEHARRVLAQSTRAKLTSKLEVSKSTSEFSSSASTP